MIASRGLARSAAVGFESSIELAIVTDHAAGSVADSN